MNSSRLLKSWAGQLPLALFCCALLLAPPFGGQPVGSPPPVPPHHRNFEGVAHEFFGMGALFPQAKEAVQFAAQDLPAAFNLPAKSNSL